MTCKIDSDFSLNSGCHDLGIALEIRPSPFNFGTYETVVQSTRFRFVLLTVYILIYGHAYSRGVYELV